MDKDLLNNMVKMKEKQHKLTTLFEKDELDLTNLSSSFSKSHFVLCGIKKFNSIKRKYYKSGEIKQKYLSVRLDCRVDEIVDIHEMVYYSRKDNKKKIQPKDMKNLSKKHVETNWRVSINIEDDSKDVLNVVLFDKAATFVMETSAKAFDTLSNKKKMELIETVKGKRISVYLQTTESDGNDRNRLESSVRSIEDWSSANEEQKSTRRQNFF
eukprot:833350_1